MDKAGGNKQGPNLHGVLGRHAGTVEGFAYTKANSESGIKWYDKQSLTLSHTVTATHIHTTTRTSGSRRADCQPILKSLLDIFEDTRWTTSTASYTCQRPVSD